MIYRGPDIQFQWMWNCECVWWMHCNAQVDHKFYNLNFILFKIVRQHQILIHFRFWLLKQLKSHTMPNEWVQSMHWQCTHVNEFNQQDVTCKYFLSMNINLLIGMNVCRCWECVDGGPKVHIKFMHPNGFSLYQQFITLVQCPVIIYHIHHKAQFIMSLILFLGGDCANTSILFTIRVYIDFVASI